MHIHMVGALCNHVAREVRAERTTPSMLGEELKGMATPICRALCVTQDALPVS